MQKTVSGIDHFLLQQNKFRHLRIALVTNDAALTSQNETGRLALLKKGFNITKFFSPEHGIAAKGIDGAYQSNMIDPLTTLPVISLYGDHLMPCEEDLADVDLLLFDIPDIGCRFYTYLWTMTYVMEACALYNKPLIILDRPNPIGGDMKKTEGPMLDESCSSFIGRWSIPIRHCCTLGELALYFSSSHNIKTDLTVIPITGWTRNKTSEENDFLFTPTSPAISTIETALCYPGTGLLEGLHINEGRGTNKAFRIFGAPWLNNSALLDALNDLQLPGVQFSEINFIPNSSLYSGETCYGLSLSVTNENLFKPVQTGISIIHQLLMLFPEHCTERLYKTVANPTGERHLDRLMGVKNSFSKLKSENIISAGFENEWQEKIHPFLLYH
jgi:uncharacterized protein YbbC (DUF1343 family)